jgi:hypothetical protein
VTQTLPLADARSLRRQAARTRATRLGLACLLVAAVAVVGLGSRHPSTTSHPYLPAGSNGVVVLDLSASISTDTFSQIGDALQRLSVSGGRYGLVIFSGSAYESLPPGTPAREFASLVPYFTLRPGHDGFAATFPLDPWTQDFSAGTSISSGLNLARSIVARDSIDHPSVLLISDLDDDPGDLRRVASSALALRRDHIPVHVIALSASASDERLFGRLFADRNAVEAAPAVGARAATAHASTPVLLVAATIAVALILAAAELVFPPLEFRRGVAA